MTEITAPKSPVTAEQFADEIREQLKYTQNVTTEQATPADVYVAASKAVRNHLADSWFKTQADTVNGNTKAVGYLSAEFLMGKQLRNALLNAGLTEQFDKAVEALGFKVQDVVDAEYEPGLGNGGLGRLAACFIDSLASLGVPAFGYGIQYKYGIFKQEFDKDGKQVETPDYWLANEEPWGHIDYNRDQKVSFGGKVVENADGTFSNGDRNAYSPLVADWLTKDWFMTLADFSAYMDIQSEIEALYADELEWNRKALLNVANSGYFSSDRSMEDYLERIWHTAPLA